jgi:hypothetical protein
MRERVAGKVLTLPEIAALIDAGLWPLDCRTKAGCGCVRPPGLPEIAQWLDEAQRRLPSRRGSADAQAKGGNLDLPHLKHRRPTVAEAMVDNLNRHLPVQRAAFGGSIDPLDAVSAPVELGQGLPNSAGDDLSLENEPVGAMLPDPEFQVAAYGNAGNDYCHMRCQQFLGSRYNVWSKDTRSAYDRCIAHCMGAAQWPEVSPEIDYGEGLLFPHWLSPRRISPPANEK